MAHFPFAVFSFNPFFPLFFWFNFILSGYEIYFMYGTVSCVPAGKRWNEKEFVLYFILMSGSPSADLKLHDFFIFPHHKMKSGKIIIYMGMKKKSFTGKGRKKYFRCQIKQKFTSTFILWCSPTNALYDINNFLCKGNKSTHYIAMARLLKNRMLFFILLHIFFMKKGEEQERK